MHGNRINNVLKEIKVAKQQLNEALYTLKQGEHPAWADIQVVINYLDRTVDKILDAGTNANPR